MQKKFIEFHKMEISNTFISIVLPLLIDHTATKKSKYIMKNLML